MDLSFNFYELLLHCLVLEQLIGKNRPCVGNHLHQENDQYLSADISDIVASIRLAKIVTECIYYSYL